MRMWMVPVSKMCRKHLLGEHVEIHMLVGTILRERSIEGYIKNDLIEPKSIYKRHQEIVEEMLKRGYNHNSPLLEINFSSKVIKPYLEHKVDSKKSYLDLIIRCKDCRDLK
ncbi:MAG: pyrimidine dimer DNA glycosylase/endonuclease V [archaeon]|jgi:uncharacterized protein (TIGR02328 family)|nr:pyrimidine dimer DNA glycosylase/endonuclease V [archaeon]MDD3084560.1 pyrimidine dimer DNA glycosylase/endonuclease V [Candidatus ainarchaeum sp.]MDD4662782.1 pyrimidine dimer DNA glycosylase/endonuclease V [Candidatus ainarchaeum sp.]